MRTDSVVLDASCIGKLAFDEPESQGFRTWLLAMAQAGTEFRAPHLLQYEVGNLLKRGFPKASPTEQGEKLQDCLAAVHLMEVPLLAPFGFQGLTYYDAAYAALGHAEGALATYDHRLAKLAGDLDVWDADAIRAAVDDGFCAWLLAYRGRNGRVADLAGEARADALIASRQTFVGVWAYLREVRQADRSRLEALDAAFAEFRKHRAA